MMLRSLARSLKNNFGSMNPSNRLSRTGLRAQRRFNTQVEPLEARTMMSLAGVLTDYPNISIAPTGTVDYKADTDRFTATSVPLTLIISQGFGRSITSASRSFSLNAEVSATGMLTGGITGPDLTVTGSVNGQALGVDLNGDNTVDALDNLLAANGPLLTGEVTDFGFLNGGNNDLFDFRVKVTGGQLASLYTGEDVGIRLTSSSTALTPSPFNGHFNSDFNQQAEGVLGGTPVAAPAINIVKFTNGTDNNTGTGPVLVPGSPVTWTYEVTNPGNVRIKNVVVTDDNGTPGNTSDDFTASYVSGDADNDGLLGMTETWLYTASGDSATGQYENTGTVTGNPLPIDISNTPLTDADIDRHFGPVPGINLVKLTNGTDNNTPTGPEVTVGSTVTWTYLVTNTGNVPLTVTSLVDDNGTAGTGDDFNPIFQSGDSNNNSLLDLDETWTFSAQALAIVGQYANSATVNGKDELNQPVSDSDVDHYFGKVPTPVLGSISGTKFRDVSGNGLSNDDVPLPGVTIQLWSDSDNDGSFDKNIDTLVDSKVSAAVTGAYSFSSLAIGRYFIDEVVPSGHLRTGPISGHYTVNLGAGQSVVNRDFANFVKDDCKCELINVIYLINGERTVTNLRGNTNEGDTVTAIFTVKPGQSVTLSLVSYTAPEPYFNANTASQQVIYDLEYGTFGEGTHSLTVVNPNSNFQVDFVCGLAIDQLGPAGSNIFYTPQGRLISADNDGTKPVLTNGSTIEGSVYVDDNENGSLDSGEQGIGYVTVRLTGVDNTGANVTLTRVTKPDGSYKFNNLKPGTYTVTQLEQPVGYEDGQETIGSLGGSNATNDRLASIVVNAGVSGIDYNFGELVEIDADTLVAGMTATIGFWNNNNGQNLIRCLNGSSNSKALGNWLASNFPNLYSNLAGQTNRQIGAHFQTLFKRTGPKVDAQLLAVALAVYVTDSDLAGTAARSYGFIVNTQGTGAAVYNIGEFGEAFGTADDSYMTIWQILKAVNSLSSGNKIYGGNSTLQMMAINVFDGINIDGDRA